MASDLGYDEIRRAEYAERLAILEQQFCRAPNPIYAWFAVAMIASFNSSQHSRVQSGTALPELEWSDWLLRYLGRAAFQIVRETDFVVPDEPGDTDMTSPGTVTDRLPGIFGFTRRGWNAFDELKRLNEAERSRIVFLRERKRGASRRDAMEAALNASGLESDRALERRWQLLRRAWGDET